MISSVTIEGFRSYQKLENFSLRPLNVLIGSNRSGKSNFLDFWEIVSHAADGELSRAISQRGGLDNIASWDERKQIEFSLRISGLTDEKEDNIYGVALAKHQFAYSVSKEFFKSGIRDESTGDDLLEISSGKGWIFNKRLGRIELQEGKLGETELTITQFRDPLAYATMGQLRSSLADITVHIPFNTARDAPMRNPQSVGAPEIKGPPTRLSRGGNNLTNVLYQLQNEVEYQDYFDEFMFTLRRAFPSLEQLRFPAVAKGKIILAWIDRDFPGNITTDLLSDGTLKFMCLLAAMYDPHPPSLLCIDEPETGLHPELIHLVADVLEEASERMQIVVATHSPELISYLKDPESVIVTESEHGWTALNRLSAEELKHWLEAYNLGELWMSGELGGRG